MINKHPISKCIVERNPVAVEHFRRVFGDWHRSARGDAQKYGRPEYWAAKNRELMTCIANDASLGREVNERAQLTLKEI
jgi:hypothetical protein